jgi:hypothetical protein
MLEQPLWPAILDRHAAAFVWAGDAIYGDEKNGAGGVIPATPVKLAADYQGMLTDNPGYQGLVQASSYNGNSNSNNQGGTTILGTWDDHDFGVDNGDRTYPHKVESAKLFVDFLERSNPLYNAQEQFRLMRQRADAGDGVYGVMAFDFAANGGGDEEVHQVRLTDEQAGIDPSVPMVPPLSDKSVAIFLIDVRSHKTPWNHSEEATDYEGDFLGEKQWEWLEASLGRSTAAVNIVVTGLQVHVDRFFTGAVAEEWSRFPMAQHRLYQAMLQPTVQSPLIVTGDVHMGEFYRRDCRQLSEDASVPSPPARPLVEVTTSGMSHSWGTCFCSRPDPGNPVCHYTYLQRVLGTAMHWGHQSLAWKDLLRHDKTGAPQYTLSLNFGEFEFDWENRRVATRLLGVDGVELQTRTWEMETLSGRSPYISSTLETKHYKEAAQKLMPHGALSTDYYCVAYRGPQSEFLKYYGFLTSLTIIATGVFLPVVLPLWLLWRLFRRTGRKSKLD